jgi:hypothetical protein
MLASSQAAFGGGGALVCCRLANKLHPERPPVAHLDAAYAAGVLLGGQSKKRL